MNNGGKVYKKIKEFYNKIIDLLRGYRVPALIDALKDEDEGVRERAAEVLVKIGETAVPALIDALKDEDLFVRMEAAEVLGKIGVNDEQFETIIKMLKNGKRWEERHGAAMALGCLKDIRAVPALIDALKDEDEVMRMEAAEALEKIGVNDEQFETIIKMLKNGKRREERHGAAAALGFLKDIRAVPVLIDALKDENGDVRRGAAWALEEIVENFVNKKLEEKDYKAALSMIGNTTDLILKMYRAEFRKKGKNWDLVKKRRELIEKLNSLTIQVKEKVELSNPLNENEPMEWKLPKVDKSKIIPSQSFLAACLSHRKKPSPRF